MRHAKRWDFHPNWWLMGLLCGNLHAATISLLAVADASIFEGNPDFDLGGTSLVSGTNQKYTRSRAMFRFDLSQLPTGAVITAAEVSLSVTTRPDPDQHGGPVDSNFDLHRLLVSWGEGTGSNLTGSVAQPGSATWNERSSGSAAWSSPGGMIGMDYAEASSSTAFISNLGQYTWGTTSLLVDDVKAWQADPLTNFGFILVSQDEISRGSGRRFGAKEQPGGTTLPAALTVTYTLVPEPVASASCFVALMLFTLRRKRPV
jgi:hypothetical protein